MKIVYFTDNHIISDGSDVERHSQLGRLIKDEEPDAVVCGGDLGDWLSCSTFYKPGSSTHWNRFTAKEEITAISESLDALRQESGAMWYNSDQWYMTEGNHEYRVERWLDDNPHMGSVLKDWRDQCGMTQTFDKIVPYKHAITLGNIVFTHMPHTLMGKPYGGVNVCRTIALNSAHNFVFGHRHRLDFYTHPLAEGNLAQRVVLSAPAFMPEGWEPDWAKGSSNGWTCGCVVINTNDDPLRSFDFEFISMSRLGDMYGS